MAEGVPPTPGGDTKLLGTLKLFPEALLAFMGAPNPLAHQAKEAGF